MKLYQIIEIKSNKQKMIGAAVMPNINIVKALIRDLATSQLKICEIEFNNKKEIREGRVFYKDDILF